MRTRLDLPDHEADRALSPEILAHIEECADCGRFRERLAAILDPSSALPREIQPSRDLWPAIASRLEEAEKPKIRSISKFLPLAAAAAIAAVVVTSLLALPLGEGSSVTTVSPRAVETAASPALMPAAAVEIGFVQTRAVLLRMIEARKSTMAPEQIETLERTLYSMDSAARSIRAALDRDPYNSSLLFKLSDTRRRELRFLQQAIS